MRKLNYIGLTLFVILSLYVIKAALVAGIDQFLLGNSNMGAAHMSIICILGYLGYQALLSIVAEIKRIISDQEVV